jgi:hypothetical protein
VFLLSERGAEQRIKFSKQDASKYVLAKLNIAGYSFEPVYNGDTLIGTKILYCICADAKGSIPVRLQGMVAPVQAKQAILNLIELFNDRKK